MAIHEDDEAIVWRIESPERPIVVRVAPAWRTAEELAWVHDLVAFATQVTVSAVAPLRAADGSTFFWWRGHPVSIFPFVDGKTLDRDDTTMRRAAATLLARLHVDLRQWPGSRPRPPSGPGAPPNWPRIEDPPDLSDAELDDWHAW